jgi:hypothetical protein
MLKYAFLKQQRRVAEICKVEDTINMLLPEGLKNIRALKEIADSLVKLEIGEAWMKMKNSPGEPYAGDLLPHGVSGARSDGKDEWCIRFASLSAVDRNLIRAAAVRVVDMINDEASRGFKASGLPADSGADGGLPEEGRGG